MTETAPEEEPMPLDGWPLSMALRLLLPEFHLRVLGAALAASEGMQDAAAVRHYRWVLWPNLVKRVARSEVLATGFRSDPDGRIPIKPTFLQDAEPDWVNNRLILGEIVFHGVRFRPADAPADQSKIDAWMSQHGSDAPKRDAALADCMAATGATWREALEAWNKLPPEVRGSRGNKKK